MIFICIIISLLLVFAGWLLTTAWRCMKWGENAQIGDVLLVVDWYIKPLNQGWYWTMEKISDTIIHSQLIGYKIMR